MPRRFRDGAADFHHQPASRFQRLASLRNQPRDHFEPGGSSEDGLPWLKFPYFQLH